MNNLCQRSAKYQLLSVSLLILFSLLLSGNAYAHQQKTAVTTLNFNHRSHSLEVMHKFYLHDAEHAVRDLFDPSADILVSRDTQETFANYVRKQFAIKDASQQNLKLEYVGLELDGNYLWIYQEAKITENLDSLSISNGALQELWPAQVNLVNIEGKGKIKSLLFGRADNWLNVELTAVN